MEIKRKKITNEEIYETEQKLIGEITALCDEKRPCFEELGYNLELVFGQKEHEAQYAFESYSSDAGKSFDSGYISHAVISIKRMKTEEELSQEARIDEENRALLEAAETEEEVQAIENEETLRVAEDANRRLIAFTELMLARTYKSFWTEWVSLGDGIREIEADLDDFYARLKEKHENA